MLSSEVSSRESHGGEIRIKTAASLPAGPSRSSTSPSNARSRKNGGRASRLDFLRGKDNVVLLGPPGTDKTQVAIALDIRPCLAGQRIAFATATGWVARLGKTKRAGKLEDELLRLGFVHLIVVDEVG